MSRMMLHIQKRIWEKEVIKLAGWVAQDLATVGVAEYFFSDLEVAEAVICQLPRGRFEIDKIQILDQVEIKFLAA